MKASGRFSASATARAVASSLRSSRPQSPAKNVRSCLREEEDEEGENDEWGGLPGIELISTPDECLIHTWLPLPMP